jgi:hypothetical protein
LVDAQQQVVKNGEVRINQRVGDYITKLIRSVGQQSAVMCDSIPDRLQSRKRMFVDRHHKALANEHVQFLCLGMFDSIPIHAETVKHQKQIIIVWLQFRPLIEVQAVFDGKRVKAESFRQHGKSASVLLQQIDPADTRVTINPHLIATLGERNLTLAINGQNAEHRISFWVDFFGQARSDRKSRQTTPRDALPFSGKYCTEFDPL